MTRIVVDAVLLDKLGNLSQFLELCDNRGRVLAHVVPTANLEEYDLTEPPISEEELDRREASDKWYTTQQVMERLRVAQDYRRRQSVLLRQEAGKLLDAVSAGSVELLFFIGPMLARLRSMINDLTDVEDTEGNTLMILNQLADSLRNDAGRVFSNPDVVRGAIAIIDLLATADTITPTHAREAYRRLRQLGAKPFVPVVLEARHEDETEHLPG